MVYSPKESSLSIVGPLGLSGSLFLGLLVFDFSTLRTVTFIWWEGGRGEGIVFLGEILTFSKVV